MPRTVAIVVSEKGYHWEELRDAWVEFERAGFTSRFFTPTGAAPAPDPRSVRHSHALARALGDGTSREEGPESEDGRRLVQALAHVRPVAELDARAVDALYLPGGHGALFDVDANPDVHRAIERLHAAGLPLTGVCHATSAFAGARATSGRPLVEGRALTGFPAPLDTALVALGMVEPHFLPFPRINDAVLREAGARLGPARVAAAMLNPLYVVEDGPFITGTGPKSAAGVARRLVRRLQG